jgi:hypothetical protein
MKKYYFRIVLAYYIISTHFLTLVFVGGLHFLHLLNYEQFTTLFAIILPMASGYTGVVIHYLITIRREAHETSQNSERGSIHPIVVGFFIITLLFVAINGTIFLQALGLTFDDFEEVKWILSALEIIFSGWVGQAIYTLFPRSDVPSETPDHSV